MNGKGFTLIELMITVAIVGILSAIAFPSYIDYVKKSRRAEVTAILRENAQIMERWYSQNGTYLAVTDAGGNAVSPPIETTSPADGTAQYNIGLGDTTTATTYTLTAAAASGGAMVGDTCASLTLNQLGAIGGNAAVCWRR